MHDQIAIQATHKPWKGIFCDCNSGTSWNYAFSSSYFRGSL